LGVQPINVLLADQAAVQHPDAFGLAVFVFHPLDHVLDGGHVGGVAREDFVADGQSLGRDDQAKVDLFAIGTLIAGITARGLRVAQGLAFEIGAGHVVKQELKFDSEPALVTRVQMLAERVLVRVQHVESAIEPALIDLRKCHAQQIFQRAVGIPTLGHFQFALQAAETGDRQNASDEFPRHLLATGRNDFLQERVQSQAAPQREGEIDLAEVAHPLHAHPAHIHLRPWRRRLRRNGLAQFALMGNRRAAFQQIGNVLPAVATALIQSRRLAQRSHDFLPRPLGRADGAHQSPVFVRQPIDRATISAQKHERRMPERPRG
jgi:hypothetical protein